MKYVTTGRVWRSRGAPARCVGRARQMRCTGSPGTEERCGGPFVRPRRLAPRRRFRARASARPIGRRHVRLRVDDHVGACRTWGASSMAGQLGRERALDRFARSRAHGRVAALHGARCGVGGVRRRQRHRPERHAGAAARDGQLARSGRGRDVCRRSRRPHRLLERQLPALLSGARRPPARGRAVPRGARALSSRAARRRGDRRLRRTHRLGRDGRRSGRGQRVLPPRRLAAGLGAGLGRGTRVRLAPRACGGACRHRSAPASIRARRASPARSISSSTSAKA